MSRDSLSHPAKDNHDILPAHSLREAVQGVRTLFLALGLTVGIGYAASQPVHAQNLQQAIRSAVQDTVHPQQAQEQSYLKQSGQTPDHAAADNTPQPEEDQVKKTKKAPPFLSGVAISETEPENNLTGVSTALFFNTPKVKTFVYGFANSGGVNAGFYAGPQIAVPGHGNAFVGVGRRFFANESVTYAGAVYFGSEKIPATEQSLNLYGLVEYQNLPSPLPHWFKRGEVLWSNQTGRASFVTGAGVHYADFRGFGPTVVVKAPFLPNLPGVKSATVQYIQFFGQNGTGRIVVQIGF